MICQYCGHKLTDGKCTNPACPGTLIVHKFSLPDGKLVEIADERVWIYDGPFDYLTIDEINVIHAEIHRNDPDIAEVEELEQDLEQYITLGSTGCRTIAEDVEFNRLHSKFLAALTNTIPYLSRDVKGVYKYEIDSPDELDVGLHGFRDEVTVIVDSGEPGGDPTGEDSFEEYMRQALIEWYDGAKVVVKKAGE
jgi:hypothetical protein